MQGAWRLVPLLVLGLAWSLQVGPVLPEPLILIQEDFDLSRVSGKNTGFISLFIYFVTNYFSL